MKRVGYLYEKMLNLDLIKLAIRKAAQGKTTRGYAAIVLNSIDSYARKIKAMLESGSVTLSPNRQITLYDRSCEKTRLITVPKNNLNEFLNSVNLGAVAACIVAIIVEHRGNKKAAKIAVESLGINTASNDEVVKIVNTLVASYNETLDKLHSMETKAEQQEHIISTLETSSKAILEILATVYANNKNIPQAVKDLVNIKYVQALKAELPLPVETEDKGSTEEG